MANAFKNLANSLSNNEAQINEELISAQRKAEKLDGYYKPNDMLAEKAMRPSSTFNQIIDSF